MPLSGSTKENRVSKFKFVATDTLPEDLLEFLNSDQVSEMLKERVLEKHLMIE